MRSMRHIAVALCVCCAASAARADISSGAWTAETLSPLAAVLDSSDKSVTDSGESIGFGRMQLATLPQAEASPHSKTIAELPAGPSSTTLFFLALGSCGAFRVGRSAKKLHLGSAPEWFGVSGPQQIGHTSIVELDASALPVCHSDEPAGEHTIRHFIPQEPRLSMQAQYLLTTDPSRGPPLLSI